MDPQHLANALSNAAQLLKHGLFQGQNAPAVAECIEVVEYLANEARAKIPAESVAEPKQEG